MAGTDPLRIAERGVRTLQEATDVCVASSKRRHALDGALIRCPADWTFRHASDVKSFGHEHAG